MIIPKFTVQNLNDKMVIFRQDELCQTAVPIYFYAVSSSHQIENLVRRLLAEGLVFSCQAFWFG